MSLSEQVLSIRREEVAVLSGAKVQEMRRPVHLVIELLRVGQLQLVLEIRVKTNTHEVVVPGALGGHHEKAEEAIAEQHLNTFIMRRQIALRVVALVHVLLAPLETARC